MKQWEYMSEDISRTETPSTVTSWANHLGSQGWEMCSSGNGFRMYKREKK